jgi:hypothetical protein
MPGIEVGFEQPPLVTSTEQQRSTEALLKFATSLDRCRCTLESFEGHVGAMGDTMAKAVARELQPIVLAAAAPASPRVQSGYLVALVVAGVSLSALVATVTTIAWVKPAAREHTLEVLSARR